MPYGRAVNRLGNVRVRDAVLQALKDASDEGRYISTEEIIDEVWGMDPDGGPLSARSQVGRAMVALRKDGVRIKHHSVFELEV